MVASMNIDTKNTIRPAEIYLKFLQLAEGLNKLPSLPPLDPLEERILQQVARSNQELARLSVRDVMAIEHLGSPATIHTRLKSMRGKGWIVLSDTEDSRRKQVGLSQAALLHFDRLSACIMEAVKV